VDTAVVAVAEEDRLLVSAEVDTAVVAVAEVDIAVVAVVGKDVVAEVVGREDEVENDREEDVAIAGMAASVGVVEEDVEEKELDDDEVTVVANVEADRGEDAVDNVDNGTEETGGVEEEDVVASGKMDDVGMISTPGPAAPSAEASRAAARVGSFSLRVVISRGRLEELK
jgi:hypothetical protein